MAEIRQPTRAQPHSHNAKRKTHLHQEIPRSQSQPILPKRPSLPPVRPSKDFPKSSNEQRRSSNLLPSLPLPPAARLAAEKFPPEFSNPPAKSKFSPIFRRTARLLSSPSAVRPHPYPFLPRPRLLPLQASANAVPLQFKNLRSNPPTIPINPPPPWSPP
jgi:hypothetical protein